MNYEDEADLIKALEDKINEATERRNTAQHGWDKIYETGYKGGLSTAIILMKSYTRALEAALEPPSKEEP